MKPRLLDLFCGAGGAAMGYHRAGFDVVGVDEAQKRYPFEFHCADAMTFPLDGFDAIHASPPCQAYAYGTANLRAAGKVYPDLLGPTRDRLLAEAEVPWVIENTPPAPMRVDYQLCGSMFDLPGLIRHRWFEVSWGPVIDLVPPCNHEGLPMDVGARTGTRRAVSPSARVAPRRTVSIIGNGTASGVRWWRTDRPEGVTWKQLCEAAMGIDWMTRHELSQAIPPAYTEFVGERLLAHVRAAR